MNDIDLDRLKDLIQLAQEMGLAELSVGGVAFKFTPVAPAVVEQSLSDFDAGTAGLALEAAKHEPLDRGPTDYKSMMRALGVQIGDR